MEYASVKLEKNAEDVSSNFNPNQGNSADPGGPLIDLKTGKPIIYGWGFFYELTEWPDLVRWEPKLDRN